MFRRTAILAVPAALFVAAALHAEGAGAAGEVVLGFAAPLVEGAAAMGGALLRGAARLAPLRMAALGLLTAALAWQARRGGVGAAVRLSSAIGLGWIAQSYLLESRTLLAVVLYTGAVALVLVGRAPGAREPLRLPRVTEAAAAGAALCAAIAIGTYRLDVIPDLYMDEAAYLTAARMQLGDLPPGPVAGGWLRGAYTLERFQSQPLPLWLQTGAAASLSPTILSMRLSSLAAGLMAWVVAAVALRAAFGRATALLALALSATAPLFVFYNRTGFYLAVTLLHAAACLAALFRLEQRWTRGWALGLGGLVGLSPYLYQLSWFVPALVGACLALSPEVWRTPRARRALVLATAATLVAAAPVALLPRAGLRAVIDQSVAKAVWSGDSDTAGPMLIQALAPGGVEDARTLLENLRDDAFATAVSSARDGHTVVSIQGPEDAVIRVRDELDPEWVVLTDSTSSAPWSHAGDMLERLFRTGGWETRESVIRVPLVNPLLAPLAVLGLALA